MKKVFLTIFVAAFFAVCILPTAALLCGYEGENYENRPLARQPELFESDGINLSFPAEFDDYFEDHFGFREEMVTAFHGLTMAAVGDTLNQKVIVGKENMLFFAETLNDYLGRELLTDDEIERIAVCLRIQQDYVLASGAEFAFAVAPNKNTVYPEYMPDYLRPSGAAGNRERLMAALERHGVNTIDLAEKLTAAKDEGLLYHYQDTHWNERGAQIGYRAIMEIAAGSGQYETYLGLEPTTVCDYGGDLHYFVLPTVEGDLPRPDYGLTFEYDQDPVRPGRATTIGTTSGANTRRLLLYRDSFGDALLPYLSANLGRVLYDAEFPYNYASFESEQPDAVVIELVERNLKNLLTKAPAMTAQEVDFDASGISGTVDATFLTVARNGAATLCGYFDADAYDAAVQRILIETDSGNCYEAFPILEEEAAQLAGADENICGFSLTLPDELRGEVAFRLILDGGGQCCASETVSIIIE